MSGPLKVARDPNSGIGAESRLVGHPVSIAIQIPEMHRMVSSRLISSRILYYIRTGEVKVIWLEGVSLRDSARW